MVDKFGCLAGPPSCHPALATATPMVMSGNNVTWSSREDLVARSFQCASACRLKSSLYLLRAHSRCRLLHRCGCVRGRQETEHASVCKNPCCRECDDDKMIGP